MLLNLGKIKKRVADFLLISISIGLYIYTVNSVGDKLDIYGAVKFYIRWIDSIKTMSFDRNLFVRINSASNNYIAAPEPIPGILIYIVTRVFNSAEMVLHILNLLVVYFYARLVTENVLSRIVAVLLVIALFTGYYEYVLLHMTHRFKIAILFFLISMFFSSSNKGLRDLFFMLSLFSHFSMLPTIVVFYLLRKCDFRNLPSFSFKFFFIVLFSLILFYGFGDSNIKSNYYQSVIGSKLNLIPFDTGDLLNYMESLPLLFFLGYIIFKAFSLFKFRFKWNFKKNDQLWVILLLFYLLITLVVIGTTRLLMVYYLVFLFVIICNYRILSKKSKQTTLFLFSPVFLYTFTNGFVKGVFWFLFLQ